MHLCRKSTEAASDPAGAAYRSGACPFGAFARPRRDGI